MLPYDGLTLFFRGLNDELVELHLIATFCILADITKGTKTLQTFLQAAWLNQYDIPRELAHLWKALTKKAENLGNPTSSYFEQLQNFLDVAAKSAGGRYCNHNYADFNLNNFTGLFVRPVICDLASKTNLALNASENLQGFVVLDPSDLPWYKWIRKPSGKRNWMFSLLLASPSIL